MLKTLAVKKIYLKDVGYNAKNTPHSFFNGDTIAPNLELNFNSQKIGENLYELIMESIVTGMNANSEEMYSVKAVIGGLFEIIGDEDLEIEECLNINCTSILFPYLRQAVDNMIHFSGFPPFIIQPVSFHQIYDSKKAKN
jgi:preprotein translocase subunit SecB